VLKRFFIPILCLLLALMAGAYLLRDSQTAAHYNVKSAVPVKEYTLTNGLKIVVMPNSRVPAVTHILYVKAGGADDPADKPGLAHFVEHMMFTGTKTNPEGVFERTITRLGGSQNAFTSYDYTAYHATLAANHLDTLMKLEADRMTGLQFTEERAARERKVIAEERGTRVDNQATTQLYEQMNAVQFLVHPYRQPLIGWPGNIASFTAEDARVFLHTYYRAENMLLLVAGDVDADEVYAMAIKHYGALPAGKAEPRIWPKEPDIHSNRTISLRDVRVMQPRLVRYYTAPSAASATDPQMFALLVLAHYVGGDSTSVLYRTLVREQQKATSVAVSYDGMSLGPGRFSIQALPAQGFDVHMLEKAVDLELARIVAAPFDPAAVARAKTQLSAEAIFAQDGLEPLAMTMGDLYMHGKTAEDFYRYQEQVHQVTEAEMKMALQQLLGSAVSVTGYLEPQDTAPDLRPEPTTPMATLPGGTDAAL
jgi:zinc protease